jgi:hypothetical protein
LSLFLWRVEFDISHQFVFSRQMSKLEDCLQLDIEQQLSTAKLQTAALPEQIKQLTAAILQSKGAKEKSEAAAQLAKLTRTLERALDLVQENATATPSLCPDSREWWQENVFLMRQQSLLDGELEGRVRKTILMRYEVGSSISFTQWKGSAAMGKYVTVPQRRKKERFAAKTIVQGSHQDRHGSGALREVFARICCLRSGGLAGYRGARNGCQKAQWTFWRSPVGDGDGRLWEIEFGDRRIAATCSERRLW